MTRKFNIRIDPEALKALESIVENALLDQWYEKVRDKIAVESSKFNFTAEQRDALTQALGTMMSEWSEIMWSAGWMAGLEENIPKHSEDKNMPLCKEMRVITEMLGHWAVPNFDYDDYRYVPYTPKRE